MHWFQLILIDWLWFALICIDSCWLLVDSCQFALILINSCWFLVDLWLIPVYYCWFFLISGWFLSILLIRIDSCSSALIGWFLFIIVYSYLFTSELSWFKTEGNENSRDSNSNKKPTLFHNSINSKILRILEILRILKLPRILP